MPENSTDAPIRQLNDDITAALKRHTARRTRHLFRVPGPEHDSHLIAALRGLATSHARTAVDTLRERLRADHDKAVAELREHAGKLGEDLAAARRTIQAREDEIAVTRRAREEAIMPKLEAAKAEIASFAQRQEAWDQAKAELKRDLTEARSSIEAQLSTIRHRNAEIDQLKAEIAALRQEAQATARDHAAALEEIRALRATWKPPADTKPEPDGDGKPEPARNRARKPAGATAAPGTGRGKGKSGSEAHGGAEGGGGK